FMTPPTGCSLAMAGIYSTCDDPKAEETPPLVTCSVLTTRAIGKLIDIHDRMPLLLPTQAWEQWLDPDLLEVGELLGPPARDLVESLEIRPVSTAVNNVRNNGAELVERVSLDAQPQAVGLDPEV